MRCVLQTQRHEERKPSHFGILKGGYDFDIVIPFAWSIDAKHATLNYFVSVNYRRQLNTRH